MKSILATLGIFGVLFSLIYAGQSKDYSKDQKPPKLIVSSPINNLITNHSKVLVDGRVEPARQQPTRPSRSGGSGGDVSPVKVTVNGKQVSVHRHGQFSTLVSLQEGKNTISIIATDANNNSTTVTRVVTWDSSPPALTVTEPVDGLITKSNSVRVSGTVIDLPAGGQAGATTVTVRVNGIFFPVDQTGAFSGTVSLKENKNKITIVASDAAKNTTKVKRMVTRDTIPPKLKIFTPANNMLTTDSTVTVSVKAIDHTKITVTISVNSGADIPVSVKCMGIFKQRVPLRTGTNTIKIVVTDAVGNRTTVTRTVIRKVTMLNLIVEEPTEGIIIRSSIIDVRGTAIGSGLVILKINGIPVSVSTDGSFNTFVNLVEGSNLITVTATDAAGNNATITRLVIMDSNPPTLTIDEPIDGLLTRDTILTVIGMVTDETEVIVTIQIGSPDGAGGTPYQLEVGNDGDFSCQVSLIEGANTIMIVATDAAGNVSSEMRNVKRDTQLPTLTIIEPVEGTIISADSILVAGMVKDSSTVMLTISREETGEIPVVVNPDGSFSGYVVLSLEGTNTMTVVATDAAGNVSSETINVRRDTEPPICIIQSPIDSLITNKQIVNVNGTVSDSTVVSLTVQVGIGTPSQLEVGSDGSFSTLLNLNEGTNIILIVATDKAGNSTTVEIVVTYEVSILPPDPATVAPPLDQTVATTMATATEFLYTGSNPIQKDVAPDTIDPIRVAVLRGKVLQRDLTPLPGVKITILNHPEFGYTLSRADGMFDLVANGGGYLTIDYQKEGYLPVQRHMNIPWQSYVVVDSIVMIGPDTVVTAIDFLDSIELARASKVTDNDGTRQATLLFTQGTVSRVIQSNGDIIIFPTLHVRATEYSVGPNGLAAMPAELPPTNAYTYCVELSADEVVNSGSESVVFDKPVIFYVDNFLNMPIGLDVPVGYYDKKAGQWIPSEDGRVIRIVNTDGGIAQIDIDGDGIEENGDSLLTFGISNPEQQKLASLYYIGKSLWRMEVTHFTTYDCNYGIQPSDGATAPSSSSGSGGNIGPEGGSEGEPYSPGGGDNGGNKPELDDCDCKTTCNVKVSGSDIAIQSQTLSETLPVIGTPFSLFYRSDRVKGREAWYSCVILLTMDGLPQALKGVRLIVTIAGRRMEKEFPPEPNQFYVFTWDGKDVYGRTPQGAQKAIVSIGYKYQGYYIPPPNLQNSFGNQSDNPTNLIPARDDAILWSHYSISMGSFSTLSGGFGSWSLDVNHVYAPGTRTLYSGSGHDRKQKTMGTSAIVNTVVGTGERDFKGDGGPATEAALSLYCSGTVVGSDGSLYIADSWNGCVRRVAPDGTITTVAGIGGLGGSSSISLMSADPVATMNEQSLGNGDGGPATEATLVLPTGIAVTPDGILYIADQNDHRIRRVSKDGTISTVAGNGDYGFSGDGGPATEASLYYPSQVAVGPDGSIYISDEGNNRIRRVGLDGFITTVAGTGEYGYSGDGGPAQLATFSLYAAGMAVASDGSLYFSDYGNGTVRKVSSNGIITTFAGTGEWGNSGDGGPATEALLSGPMGLAVMSNGTLFIADYDYSVIRKVDPNGIITTIAGIGNRGYTGNGGPALRATFDGLSQLAISPNGCLYVSEEGNSVVRRIAHTLPGFSLSDIQIASEDGSEIYTFDFTGKHLCTIDALTRSTIFSFSYDSFGRLSEIQDIDSLVTRIERDNNSNLITIISPFGQQTTLHTDSLGYLASATNPAGETVYYDYSPKGLITSYADAKGNRHYFGYDKMGRLIYDVDPVGGFKQLDRTDMPNGYEVKLTTAEGRSSKYRIESLPTGLIKLTNTNDAGLSTLTLWGKDGTTETIYPDGTMVETIDSPDPRYGMQVPLITTTTSTPNGLVSTVEQYRTISQMSGLTISGITDSVVVNGRVYKSVYNGEQKLFTSIFPEGRQSFSWINEKGRVIKDSIPGIEATTYSYDSQGRLVMVSQAGRTASYTYDAKSFLAKVMDPNSRTSRFEYDSVGRITRQILPDNHEILYSYDANGNLTSLTPPSKPVHIFDYTKVDLTEKYTPPILGIDTTITRYVYNKDRQILRVIRPDGGVIETIYDSVGCSTCGSPVSRTKTILFNRGELGFRYSPFTGNLDTLTAPAETLSYTYDSSLPKSVIWSGEVNGTVSVEYDNNMRVTTQSINDGNTVSFQYDQDGLLTQAGEMTITREPETGRISGTTLGNVTTSQGYNSLGELTSYEAKYNGNPIFQTSYTRDSLGRITQLLETVQGQQKEMSYAYDVAGRLWKVWRNDTLISMYSYDPNGNRIAHITLTSVDSGVYDAQDRLLHYSNSQYLFTLNGELRMKIESTDTTHYIYDYFGNLVTVVLPDKDRIDYIIDGQNRRIGKKVNGRVVKRWIYSRQLSPVAELDSSGNVVAQFVGNFLIKNNTIYQLITDHLGSVRLVINVESGEIVERTDYDEYGNILERSEISTWSGQPFAYAGGLYDQQTKLVRFGFRDYEAETGRWTCKDPIGFIGGMNLYNYVAGNAVNKTDQFGLLSSYWHYAISYSAAKTAGFSDQAAEYIAQAAVAADNGTQGPSPEMNAVHATIGKDPSTGNFQSPEQAYSNTVTFVKSQLAFANKFKQEGNCLGYYQAIGFALHPAQDQWAGGHSYTPFRGYLNPSIVPHAAMDYFPSEATLNAALFSSLQILEGNLQSALPPIK